MTSTGWGCGTVNNWLSGTATTAAELLSTATEKKIHTYLTNYSPGQKTKTKTNHTAIQST